MRRKRNKANGPETTARLLYKAQASIRPKMATIMPCAEKNHCWATSLEKQASRENSASQEQSKRIGSRPLQEAKNSEARSMSFENHSVKPAPH